MALIRPFSDGKAEIVPIEKTIHITRQDGAEEHVVSRISPEDEVFHDLFDYRARRYEERNGAPEYADELDHDPNRTFTYAAGVRNPDTQEIIYGTTVRLVIQDHSRPSDGLREFSLPGISNPFRVISRFFQDAHPGQPPLEYEQVGEISRLAAFGPLREVIPDFLLCMDALTAAGEQNGIRVYAAVMQRKLADTFRRLGYQFEELPLIFDRSDPKVKHMFKIAPYYFFDPKELEEFAITKLRAAQGSHFDEKVFRSLSREEKVPSVLRLFESKDIFEEAYRKIGDGATLYIGLAENIREMSKNILAAVAVKA